ncbi:MAG TPA: rod shape-determining protein MreC [Candidatus Moranbacteria bacterium]|nr:rod shape-determining protein MreC [Candidatus Moranbacteria bacterium]
MFKKNFFEKKIKSIIILGIILFIIIWNPNSIFDGVRNVFFTATYPIQKILSISADKIYYFTETVSSIGTIRNENNRLLSENLYLKSENTKLRDISKENETLRKELKLLPRKKFNLITANVVGRDLYKSDGWMLIDKGERDGLKKEMPVIIENGILVGKISEVFPYNAKIIAITNVNSNINATTVETGAMGIIKSKYGLGVTLDMVLQTDYLKVGDDVITSEISQNIPRGLLIGKIQEVHPSADQLFQTAVLSIPIDFSKLRFVSVIKN